MAEYISKKEVLDYLNGYLHTLGYDNTDLIVNGQRHALINVLEDILTVKAADVQPMKHGYWKEEEPRVLKCSVCGEYAPMNYLGQNCIDSSYCPWCGARMDGDAK